MGPTFQRNKEMYINICAGQDTSRLSRLRVNKYDDSLQINKLI